MLRILTLLLTLLPTLAACAPSSTLALYTWNAPSLQESRRRLASGDPLATAAVARLRQDADQLLTAPLAVVTDKKHPAPSNDPHDYVSLARYVWPDPSRPDGLPWITRDGQTNPLTREYDNTRLVRMITSVETLSLAYWFTGHEPYARRAAAQLRAWFLDPATRMNPHLNHAQMHTGRNTGSAIGIIDTWRLPHVLDSVALLRSSPAWSARDDRRLQAWFADFKQWLLTSPLGQREGQATNNHGTWYDVQVLAFALYTGDTPAARRIAEEAKTTRIARQIAPDGTMARELGRTLSFNYTCFNLEALLALAQAARRVNIDLLTYETPDRRSIPAALDYLLPYATREKPWPHNQITPPPPALAHTLFRQAARLYPQTPAYAQALQNLPTPPPDTYLLDLLYPPPSEPSAPRPSEPRP